MAKYLVTYSCGCQEYVQLYGKMNERDSRLAYLSAKKCPKCYHAELLEEVETKSSGMPKLEGSEKQIAWAMTIRSKMFDAVKAYEVQIDSMPVADENKAKAHKMFSDFYAIMLKQTSCRYWIDNRYDFDFTSFRDVCAYVDKKVRI